MAYAPVNVDAYTNAYSGALAGMAISGWIVDPTSADYSNVASIAGAFAQAFDIVWNSATALNWLQVQSIQSVCQEQFAGHAPGSLDNTAFSQASNWAVPAAACAALVLQGSAFVTSEGITPNSPGGAFAPIQNTYYWEPGFAGVANGSIAAPYPLLAPLMTTMAANLGEAWLLYIPGGNLVQDAPVPDLGEGALVVSGIFPDLSFISSPWVIQQQSGGGSYMGFRDLWLSSLELNGPGSLQLQFSNCFIDGLTVTGGLEGTAVFRDTGAANIAFPATDNYDIKMYGGGLSGNCSWRGGEVFNASIGGGSTYVLGLAVTRFVGCTFGAGITIDNTNTPTLEMDTFSHSTFISSGVTFAGTVIVLS